MHKLLSVFLFAAMLGGVYVYLTSGEFDEAVRESKEGLHNHYTEDRDRRFEEREEHARNQRTATGVIVDKISQQIKENEWADFLVVKFTDERGVPNTVSARSRGVGRIGNTINLTYDARHPTHGIKLGALKDTNVRRSLRRSGVLKEFSEGP